MRETSPFSLGVDVGTTSVKIVLLTDRNEVQYSAEAPQDGGLACPARLWATFVDLVKAVPAELRGRITSIHVSAAMHGAVGFGPNLWSEVCTWEDRRVPRAEGFPCASGMLPALLRVAEDSLPGWTAQFEALGTVGDLLTYLLCAPAAAALLASPPLPWPADGASAASTHATAAAGTAPSRPWLTDPALAHSSAWTDAAGRAWDKAAFERHGLADAATRLPRIVPTGTVAGSLSDWARTALQLGPSPTPGPARGVAVHVATGDHGAGLLGAAWIAGRLPATSVAVVNVGTSAQVAILATTDAIDALRVAIPATCEVRPGTSADTRIIVAASMNGGNTFAWLGRIVAEAARGAASRAGLSPADVERIRPTHALQWLTAGEAGDNPGAGGLSVLPTLFPERRDPSPEGASMSRLSPGSTLQTVAAAWSHGLVEQWASMLPPALLRDLGASHLLLIGGGLARNATLRAGVERAFARPAGGAGDAAGDRALRVVPSEIFTAPLPGAGGEGSGASAFAGAIGAVLASGVGV